MSELLGRPTVVVGANGALGRAVCAALLQAGADVSGLDRQSPSQPLDGVQYAALDVLADAELGAWFDGGTPPWAVLNVVGGYAPAASLTSLDADELVAQLKVNLVTAALVTKHALRRMAGPGEGRLVHTASRAALDVGGVGFAYSVSKLGVLHLVRMAANEVRGTGITVNAVVPSIMDTPANRAAMPDARTDRWPTVDEVAALFVFLASPASKLVSGAAIPAYGQT